MAVQLRDVGSFGATTSTRMSRRTRSVTNEELADRNSGGAIVWKTSPDFSLTPIDRSPNRTWVTPPASIWRTKSEKAMTGVSGARRTR